MKRVIIAFVVLLIAGIIILGAFGVGHALGKVNGTVKMKVYERDVHEIVQVINELSAAGRTNDINQVCQNFESVYVMKPSDMTNLDQVIYDAENRVSKQPFTRLPK